MRRLWVVILSVVALLLGAGVTTFRMVVDLAIHNAEFSCRVIDEGQRQNFWSSEQRVRMVELMDKVYANSKKSNDASREHALSRHMKGLDGGCEGLKAYGEGRRPATQKKPPPG
jgi:hypothetical protein